MASCDNKIKQKEFVKAKMNLPMVPQTTWFILDMKWWLKWRQYVGYDAEESLGLSNGSINSTDKNFAPDKIDNNLLLDNQTMHLKCSASDRVDYTLVPESVWTYLKNIYGSVHSESDEKNYFSRNTFKTNSGSCIVDIRPMKLSLHLYDSNNFHILKIPRVMSIEKLLTEVKSTLHVPSNTQCRLLFSNKRSNNKYNILTVEESTLIEDSGLQSDDEIFLDKYDGKSWLSQPSKFSPQNTSSKTFNNGDSFGKQNGERIRTKRGLCGLSNMGNTCFMNSALQCVSNVQPLTEFFLQSGHQTQLNYTNPLGMRGEIAKTYASLIQTIWSGKETYTTPREFKIAVSRFAPQFSGYCQHDSQELLMFLLDGLHEDLNRIKKKHYMEAKDEDGRPEKELADESWKYHLQRNNSIITDLFHGLLKSHVVCPDCHKVSITFDPYSSLSLPLPTNNNYIQVVFYVPSESESIYKVHLSCPKQGSVDDLIRLLGEKICKPVDKLYVTEIYDNKCYKVFSKHEQLATISGRDLIYVYYLPNLNEQNYELFKIEHSYREKFIYLPFFVTIKSLNSYSPQSSKFQLAYRSVINALNSHLSRDLKVADVNETEGDLSAFSAFFNIYLFNNSLKQELKLDSNPITLNSHSCNLLLDWTDEGRQKLPQQFLQTTITDIGSTYSGNLRNQNSLKLMDCFDLFTKSEQLGRDDMWYCSRCKEHKAAKKKFDIWSLPEVLVIHLKRFHCNRYTRDKVDDLVDFPIENLDLSKLAINESVDNCLYDLVSISNHMGGLGGGHYTAFGKNFIDGKWHKFDDASVSDVSNSRDIITKAAYVLIYQRKKAIISQPRMETNHNNNSFNNVDRDEEDNDDINFNNGGSTIINHDNDNELMNVE